MSARPSPLTRPSDEELDLLLSRSVDGDLAPAEEEELAKLLAADPEVRRRRDRLAALVEELGRVPAPAPPFALATRVTSNVLEKAGAPGGGFGLAARAPRMGVVFVMMGALAFVFLYRYLMTGGVGGQKPATQVASSETARKAAPAAEGPVEVFFLDSKKQAPPAPAAPPAAAPVQVAEARPASRLQHANEAGSIAAPAPPEAERQLAKGRAAGEPAPSRREADAYAPEAPSLAARSGSRDERAGDADALGRSEEKAKESKLEVASAAPAPAPAPAAPAAAGALAEGRGVALRGDAEGTRSRPAGKAVMHDAPSAPSGPGSGFTVAAPSGGASAWRVERQPDLSSLPSPLGALYRLSIDGTGRVVALRKLSCAPDSAAASVEKLLRGLSFVPVPGVATSGEVEIRVSRD